MKSPAFLLNTCLLGLLLLVGCREGASEQPIVSIATPQAPAGWSLYTDAQDGFRFAYPPGWFLMELENQAKDDHGVVLSNYPPGESSSTGARPPGGYRIELLSVGSQEMAPGQGIESWRSASLDYTPAAIQESKHISVAGIDSLQERRLQDNEEVLATYIPFKHKKQGAKVLAITTRGTQQPALLETYQALLTSLVFNELAQAEPAAEDRQPDVYLPAITRNSSGTWIAGQGCPNPQGLQPSVTLTPEDAWLIINLFNSNDLEARKRVADPSHWEVLAVTPPRSEAIPAEWLLPPAPASGSPSATFLANQCGQEAVDASTWVGICASACSPEEAYLIESNIYLVNRAGQWLIWAKTP